ncbi:MAG TPA: molecular chaperone TorD family protein [bacterium]|nr:molecular chaperone TorD family protein [bacterium]
MELLRALATLAEPPGSEHAHLGGLLGLPGAPEPALYTEVFAFNLYPYASVYVGREGMLGGEARDRVAGFWRALGRVPPVEPDHVTALLALYATLAEQEAADPDPASRLLWRQSRKALLWEHLASWLFVYLDKLGEVAPPFYKSWGALLGEALVAEIQVVGPQEALALHLRLAPALPDPRQDGAEEFVGALLSPVRSGVLLTRADLTRAARDLGVGVRMGERRFILTSLLSQDAEGMLGWLTAEARGWAARHRTHGWVTGRVARFWAGQAASAAALLEALHRSAGRTAESV